MHDYYERPHAAWGDGERAPRLAGATLSDEEEALKSARALREAAGNPGKWLAVYAVTDLTAFEEAAAAAGVQIHDLEPHEPLPSGTPVLWMSGRQYNVAAIVQNQGDYVEIRLYDPRSESLEPNPVPARYRDIQPMSTLLNAHGDESRRDFREGQIVLHHISGRNFQLVAVVRKWPRSDGGDVPITSSLIRLDSPAPVVTNTSVPPSDLFDFETLRVNIQDAYDAANRPSSE